MMANMQIVGENIRKLRTAKKLSQQRLAELAGISCKYLGEIERGQSNVSVEILFQIASGMDISASTFLKNRWQW